MSSSPSSSSEDGNGNGNGNGTGTGTGTGRGSRRRRRRRRRRARAGSAAGGLEGPSSSRQRRGGPNDVWPEPFLEALSGQVAVDAATSFGRLAAAPSLANLFQVCSTWRSVSRSELLWARLTGQIWGRTHATHATWRDEFAYHHRTYSNFRFQRYVHATLHFDPSEVTYPEGLICRCLTLSERYLASGFADGTVRLFDLSTLLHVGTFQPHPGNGLGPHPRAVSGIVITGLQRLVFATLDGDIHVAMIDGGAQMRRAHRGDVFSDGNLVDFSGSDQWWVGLYAGVPGRAFHIWDGESEELVFVGGTLTDPESVRGWHMLTGLNQFAARVRVAGHETAVACTSTWVIAIHLRDQGVILGQHEYRRGLIVTATDTNADSYIVVDTQGLAAVRHVDTGEEVCHQFTVRGAAEGRVMGCMNFGYALMWAGGVTDVWDTERGEYLYSLAERMREVSAIAANDRLVAAYGGETAAIHLWDFGAR